MDAGTDLRDVVTDALRHWEPRRILYNLLLAAVVMAHFIAAWPASGSSLTLDGFLLLFLLAVLANLAYSAVYVADVFIQLSGFRANRAAWRRLLLVVGFAFAAVLTHFFASGMWASSYPAANTSDLITTGTTPAGRKTSPMSM